MLDQNTLYKLYVDEEKTGKEIAAIAGVKSPETIYTWLRKYGIPRRDFVAAQRAVKPSQEQLHEMYIIQEMSIDQIARMVGSSESSISKLFSEYGIPKRSKTSKFGGWNKGKSLPEHQRELLSQIAKKRTGAKSPRYGAKLDNDTRTRIATSLRGRFRGAENPQWQGGKKYEREQWHDRFEYKDWRKAVFARDNYTCQMCNQPSTGNIQAHHVIPWRSHPDGRFDVSNGITLCVSCHLSIKGKEHEFAEHFGNLIHQSTL